MAIVRYQPWDFITEMNKMLDVFGGRRESSDLAKMETSQWIPAVDIRETKDAILIHADLPGVRKENIELSVDNNVLTIKGTREEEKKDERDETIRVERFFGSFSRSFSLPNNVALDKVDAKNSDGVLEVTIPKQQISASHKIAVK
jgi:HSP20 family protein